MAARPQGDGYWIVAEDGGVFSFGNAAFHGSGVGLVKTTVVGLLAAASGTGYSMLTRDGGATRSAPFYGSGAGAVNGQAVGIAGKLV